MVSAVITNPKTGTAITANQDFDITVQTANLVAGSFTNADNTYYSAPQALSGGKVVGHTHVTVQDMGNTLNPTKALDATQFAFFKGINDAGNGNGLLSATVTGGLPAGNYRVCTMTSSSNHQPVLMPVAQRGTPDDCTKFVVSAAGGATANTGNGATGGKAAASSSATKASATKATGGKAAASSSTDKASAASKAATGGKGAASSSASKAAATKTPNAASQASADSKASKASQASKDSQASNDNASADASSTSEPASAATSKASKGGKAAASSVDNQASAAPTKASNAGSKASATPASSAASSKATKAPTSKVSTASASVGGIDAPGVTDSGDAARPFSVNGNSFVNEAAAVQRSCDVQFNACANAFNSGAAAGAFTIADCSTQQTACNAA